MAHISEEKKKEVKELVDLINGKSVVGIVDLESLPAKQLQMMREKLRETVTIRMSKKRLMALALKEAEKGKKDLFKLSEHFKGMSALLVSEESPFKLFKILKKNKSSAPAKAGQEAPKDIIVKAGKTNFAPGPIISELAKIGIKTQVEGGKLAIKQDAVVAKEGDIISDHLAKMLARLGIEPMEIGLSISAMYENGEILKKSVLDIDEEQYIRDVTQAHTFALNLAVEAGIYNDVSAPVMVTKAARNVRALSTEAGILTAETVGDILAKTQRTASGLKANLQL